MSINNTRSLGHGDGDMRVRCPAAGCDHPVVYFLVEKHGVARCPYCDAAFRYDSTTGKVTTALDS